MVCNHCGFQNDAGAKYCSGCRRKLKNGGHDYVPFGKYLKIAGVTVVTVLMVLGLFKVFFGQKNTAENTWKNNVLMRDRVLEVIPLGSYKSSIVMDSVFGSDLMRNDIGRVVFEDSVENAPDDCWDASEAQDNSVVAWVIPYIDNLYELHIAADGGINGRVACEDLFCGYANLSDIDFNNCFHTEEAEDFSRMFYGCWQLEKLDLSGIKTDNAINLSEMFAHCFYLHSLDVSGFETSNVEDTSGMFSVCENLTTLNIDLMDMDTYHVRDVSYMFHRCPAAARVYLEWDDFVFQNVDRYEMFMDEGMEIDGEPWEYFFTGEDYVSDEKETSVQPGDIVIFGSYEQDNNIANDQEPIEWLVLDVQGSNALLLSRYALDSQPYHNVSTLITWESCSLRKWLNSEFLDAAFTKKEREAILMTEVDNSASQSNREWQPKSGNSTKDLVFLLSYAETERYFNSQMSRVCSPTSYAISMGADIRILDGTSVEVGWWWLRSPGENGYQASFVNYDGTRYTNMVSNGYLSVRPAIWFDLSKAVLEN